MSLIGRIAQFDAARNTPPEIVASIRAIEGGS